MYPDKQKLIDKLMTHFNTLPEESLINIIETFLIELTTEELAQRVKDADMD